MSELIDVSTVSVRQLLGLHAGICTEPIARGVTKTANNPTGDFAEYLFCKAFSWDSAPNSERAVDALEGNTKYQIKGRRLASQNTSRQLGVLRNLDKGNFDYLAAVLFGSQFDVFRAAIIPYAYVNEIATYSKHQNGWILHLRDSIWSLPGVRDVTQELTQAADWDGAARA